MTKFFKASGKIILLVFLISTAFHAGKRAGFRTGSEWAMVQATIVAREAGMMLPVYLQNGAFRVVFRQPPGLYRKAWQLADEFDRENSASRYVEGERTGSGS
jgi:hypothetical protein